MICYKDMTFCPFHTTCANPCSRALTEDVHKAAEEWWGGDNCPISYYTEKPSCWQEREK